MRGVIIFVLAVLVSGCGSRKLALDGKRRDLGMMEETERSAGRSWLEADAASLARALREMEWEFRRVEERDSSGNERVITEGVGRLREREERRDSVGLESRDTTERIKEKEGVMETDTKVVAKEERESAAREWKWIVWGVVTIVIGGIVFRRKN